MLEVFAGAGYAEQDVLYFDTPSCGLPSPAAVEALVSAARQWGAGEHFTVWEQEAAKCREEFARQRELKASQVGLLPSITSAVAAAATALARQPGLVLAHRREFRSLLLPFMAAFGEDRVRWVEGDYTVRSFTEEVDDGVIAVIASSIASHDGARLNLQALAETAHDADAALIVDSTQSEGIVSLGVPYRQCALVVTAGYKGLLGPRGTGYAVASEGTSLHYPAASPYGMQDTGQLGSYGPPLLPFPGGRGLEQSPAWQCWGAARQSLAMLGSAGREIEPHVLRLTSMLRDGLRKIGITAQRTDLDSPVVSFPVAEPEKTQKAISRANIRAAIRAGRLRLGAHGYTSAEHVEQLLDVLSAHRHLLV